jgi:hypothetical protein
MVKAAFAFACCLTLVGCGPVVPSRAQSGVSCSAQTTGLLTSADLPAGLTQISEGSSPTLGLWGHGNSAYPGFVGRSQRNFLWSGLSSDPARAYVQQAWADLHYEGQAPEGFIPKTGPLFTAFPTQIFQLSESSSDFGSVQNAQKWLSGQRFIYQPNNDPKTRSGVTAVLQVARIGDETFSYQLNNGPSGDLYTNVQARSGSVVWAISIDSGPQYSASPQSVGFITSLAAREHAKCGSAA